MFRLLIPLMLVLCFSCSSEDRAPELTRELGSQTIDAIRQTTQITFSEPLSGQSYILPDKQRDALIRLLTDDSNYIFDKTKSCLFIPEMTLAFKGDAPLVIQFSPSCRQIKVVQEGKSTILDCDRMMPQLEQLLRRP